MTTYYNTDRHPVRAHWRRIPSGRVVPVRSHWRDNPTPNLTPADFPRDYAWESFAGTNALPDMYENWEAYDAYERLYLDFHGIGPKDYVYRPDLMEAWYEMGATPPYPACVYYMIDMLPSNRGR